MPQLLLNSIDPYQFWGKRAGVLAGRLVSAPWSWQVSSICLEAAASLWGIQEMLLWAFRIT